jgi:hypothetical protein
MFDSNSKRKNQQNNQIDSFIFKFKSYVKIKKCHHHFEILLFMSQATDYGVNKKISFNV